jgi:hypothetical protein
MMQKKITTYILLLCAVFLSQQIAAAEIATNATSETSTYEYSIPTECTESSTDLLKVISLFSHKGFITTGDELAMVLASNIPEIASYITAYKARKITIEDLINAIQETIPHADPLIVATIAGLLPTPECDSDNKRTEV